MNIYQKLQAMRCRFQGEKIKKSGKNKFAGYEYFELSDIIPSINKLMEEYGLTSLIKYENHIATLILINAEKPEETMTFTSPMAEATLKGCHAVQNLGATMTYLRRYLWTNAMEIVETDILDASKPLDNGHQEDPNHKINGKNYVTEEELKDITPPQEEPPTPPIIKDKYLISEKQRKLVYARWKAKDIPDTKFKAYLQEQYHIGHTKDIMAEWLDQILEDIKEFPGGRIGLTVEG